MLLKFRYCEKTTKFEKNLQPFFFNYIVTSKEINCEIFEKFCGILRISERTLPSYGEKKWRKAFTRNYPDVIHIDMLLPTHCPDNQEE